jgi:chemotaxis signal transduction protein
VIGVGERRYITFNAGGHRFAVPIEEVGEVVSSAAVIPVPSGRRPLEGIIRYRDRAVLPVFSLLEILGEQEAEESALIVVAGPEESPLGFRVRGLGGIITLTESEEGIVPYEGKLGGPEGAIAGILKKTGGDHILLDIGKVLGS